jgi:hypothetical protein
MIGVKEQEYYKKYMGMAIDWEKFKPLDYALIRTRYMNSTKIEHANKEFDEYQFMTSLFVDYVRHYQYHTTYPLFGQEIMNHPQFDELKEDICDRVFNLICESRGFLIGLGYEKFEVLEVDEDGEQHFIMDAIYSDMDKNVINTIDW